MQAIRLNKAVNSASVVAGFHCCVITRGPIPVAVRSKAWVLGRSLTRIVDSNPTGGMDVCVVLVVRTVAWNVK